MSLHTKKLVRDEQGNVEVTYTASHSGTDYRTVLDLDMTVRVTPDRKVSIYMEFETPPTESLDSAMDKLEEWLVRTADAIRGRKGQTVSVIIPIYDEKF